MGKKKHAKIQIMTLDQERFMAFEGLLDWTMAVCAQYERLAKMNNDRKNTKLDTMIDRSHFHDRMLRTEYHYFCIAANKLFEYRDWTISLGICIDIDYSEIDSFSRKNIRDLRNMKEHIVEYFSGEGRDRARWVLKTPGFNSDASAVNGALIGGRLDWVAFGLAAKCLLPRLLSQPMPVAVGP
ncbi:hypothetical protein [Ancylobacter mangrovi]|uniref:hypothetical protein n=1 Tax=Ancylobacter mangrovi TaxID=2972472 RepID=UPI00216352CC|nr:hypothetical protein [Ancylobacter mangrovi]MCS0503073.1 hypothetical protein [Ancylobacter mangrovi]